MNLEEAKNLEKLFDEATTAVIRAGMLYNEMLKEYGCAEYMLKFSHIITEIDERGIEVEWHDNRCGDIEGHTVFPFTWIADETYEEAVKEAVRETRKKKNLKKLREHGKAIKNKAQL